jgi:dTDP-4-dehydrorhamnose reductase
MLSDVTAPTRSELDIARADREQLASLVDSSRPDVVINCVAYTAVDEAEKHEEESNKVNGYAVGCLAGISADSGVPLVTFSTDHVFDGQTSQPYVESSTCRPINAYGRSKLLGERLAFEANPRTLMIRTSWVISATHPNFVSKVLTSALRAQPVRAVDDQRGTPTIVSDLAAATIEAIEQAATGLLHLTNQGSATWFDLAQAAVEVAGLDPDLVTPCTTADYPTAAPRPAFSVLGSERLDEVGVSALPPWNESLSSVVNGVLGRRVARP